MRPQAPTTASLGFMFEVLLSCFLTRNCAKKEYTMIASVYKLPDLDAKPQKKLLPAENLKGNMGFLIVYRFRLPLLGLADERCGMVLTGRVDRAAALE
jgi:hypothetical protein